MGELFIKYKCCGGYTGLRHPQVAIQFPCQFPVSELAMPTIRRFDEFGQHISIIFDNSEMNWRIFVPYNKLYIISII